MMAREAGIPARMAIGFLPGTADRGTYTVGPPTRTPGRSCTSRASAGCGSSRRRPAPRTPSPRRTRSPRRPPAARARRPAARPAARPRTPRAPMGATTPAPPTRPRTPRAAPPASVPGSDLGTQTTVLWIVLGLLIGILGSLAVPLAARSRLRRRLRRAPDESTRVEIEWQAMIERIGDLGVIPPRGSTPRQAGRFYQREAYLEGDQTEALQRVVSGVERSRYAPPGATIADIRQRHPDRGQGSLRRAPTQGPAARRVVAHRRTGRVARAPRVGRAGPSSPRGTGARTGGPSAERGD